MSINFGENFKKLRQNAKLSQKEVAEKLGIYQSNVSDWENDVSRPEYEKLIQLKTLYGCSIAKLLGVEEDC